MTQIPSPPNVPPVGYGYGQQGYPQRQSNGAAIASLVFGILGCVPFLTGLLAILFGFIGLRKTRDPYVGGKGLAIAGLVLGILSILGWASFSGVIGWAYVISRPARTVATQFVQDLAAGNVTAAQASSMPGVTTAQLQATNQTMQSWGALQSVTFSSYFANSSAGGSTDVHLGGVAMFANGAKAVMVHLVKQGTTYKVADYSIQ
jgi:hypothetical protein